MNHTVVNTSWGEADRLVLKEAEALFDNGGYERCEMLCEELRRRYPLESVLPYIMGRCHQTLHRPDEARAAYAAAIALDARCWDAYYFMGSVLIAQANYRAAIDILYTLLQRRPDYGGAWTLLGGALSKIGEHEHALECCGEALRANPSDAAAMYNCSFAYAAKDDLDSARTWIDAALRIEPSLPVFHMHRASVLLRAGEYEEGWREWEWRLAKEDFRALNLRCTQSRRWAGESLEGRTVLVWSEQGLGDTIQCARFLRMLKAQGARVLFECQKELIPVFRTLDGADVIFERFAECPEPFDHHVPLMSLPMHLGLTPESIPSAEGYLNPSAYLSDTEHLPIESGAYSIGLAWEGSRLSPVNYYRSGIPEMFSPLFGIPDCTLYSLQHETPKETLPSPIRHCGLRSMRDLAGAIARMDLIVTIDTSIAHLAGAMGKEVWLLLSALPDWRWQLRRDTSPWYATMRIFRQRTLGEWMPLTLEAANEIRLGRCVRSITQQTI